MAEQYAALAPHLQIIVGAMILAGSGIWGVIKFFRPFIDSIHKPSTVQPTDAVMISASLADGKMMGELKDSIERLAEAQEKANIINTMMLEAIIKLTLKP